MILWHLHYIDISCMHMLYYSSSMVLFTLVDLQSQCMGQGSKLEPCADVSISAAARRVILTGGGGAPIDFFRRRRRQ